MLHEKKSYQLKIQSLAFGTTAFQLNGAATFVGETPSMHWQMGIDPQYWSYLFIVLEGYVDKNKNNVFESGESFVFHIGNDGLTSNSNLINFSASVNENKEFIVEFDIDWHEAISGIDMAHDNFTHTMDNFTLAQSISSNCSNLMRSH